MYKKQAVTIKVVPVKKDPLSTNSKNIKAEFFSNDGVLKLHLAKMQLEKDDSERENFAGQNLVFVNE